MLLLASVVFHAFAYFTFLGPSKTHRDEVLFSHLQKGKGGCLTGL